MDTSIQDTHAVGQVTLMYADIDIGTHTFRVPLEVLPDRLGHVLEVARTEARNQKISLSGNPQNFGVSHYGLLRPSVEENHLVFGGDTVYIWQ